MRLGTLLTLALLVAMTCPAWALEAVLVYQGDNHWVAPADNKPLVKLLAAAKAGETHYRVKLPKENRALAVERLDVLAGLLSREAKASVIIDEVKQASKANTIVVTTTD